jgi:hypothetical protein
MAAMPAENTGHAGPVQLLPKQLNSFGSTCLITLVRLRPPQLDPGIYRGRGSLSKASLRSGFGESFLGIGIGGRVTSPPYADFLAP